MTSLTPMNGMNDDSNPVFQRALQWLSDLQDGDTDSAALFRWLAESPRHVEEFALALSFSDEIAGLTDEQCAAIAAMNVAQRQTQAVVPLTTASIVREPKLSGDKGPKRPGSKLLTLVASLVAAILVGGGFLWWDNGWRTYATDFGEQRVVELSDGSAIHLNTETRVKVKYSSAARDIRLLRGEALFKAQRDPLHPFRVHTNDSLIQAVGTQFNVYRRSTGTTVAVLEGSVRITPDVQFERMKSDAQGVTPTGLVENLRVGQEARIAPEGRILKRQIDIRQAAAWRQHRLVFRNDTLIDIAAEFNRYNRQPQIRIEDARAGGRRFAATFDADAPESLVQVLLTHPDLTVEHTGSEILVRSRAVADAPTEAR